MRESLYQLALLIVPVLFSLTVHELCHGYAAYRMGDPTAKSAGRLTMNPFRHISPIGILALFLTRMIGWAKPIPVDIRFFKNPRKDMLWVALVGPMSNVALALAFALIYRLVGPHLDTAVLLPAKKMLEYTVIINVGLAVFNFIPLPPLDGGRIIVSLLPERLAMAWSRIEPYGILILILILVSPAMKYTIFPVVQGIVRVLIA